MIIKLENGKPTGHPIAEGNFKQLFPSVSFPLYLLPKDVEPFGYGMYDFSQMPEVGRYEKLEEGDPQKDDRGVWRQAWNIVAMTTDEKAEVDARREEEMRNQRYFYLVQTDWTQMDDSPLDESAKQSFRVYRQALRDITEDAGFPWDIIWPEKPA